LSPATEAKGFGFNLVEKKENRNLAGLGHHVKYQYPSQ
jgi:hypothetical protein